MDKPTASKFSIKIEKHVAEKKFPKLCLFMGLPKIGKSTAMAALPQTLICDLEGKGYDGINVENLVRISTLRELKDTCMYFFSPENKDLKVLVIDHIRALTSFYSKNITSENKVRYIEEIQYGRGSFQLKNNIDSFLKWLNSQLAENPDKYVFLVGHAIDRNGEIRLDCDGKNETMILGLMDAVGFIDREDDVTTVDFQAHRGVEFGTRNAELAKYNGPLDWTVLFNIATGKTTLSK